MPRLRLAACAAGLAVLVSGTAKCQVLETETARLLPAGALEAAGAFEYQTSVDGTESALPFALTFGVSHRLELLIEPVARTTIRPSSGPRAAGVGDLEVTTTFLARRETPGTPAIAFAGEVKLPTARNRLIGTGKTDVAAYVIASKRFGRFDTHANVSYTIVGQPAGTPLGNIIAGAVATEVRLSPRFELFGEVLANTASTPGGGDAVPPGGTVTPEAAGGEVVLTAGAGVHATSRVFLSMAISYDNNAAVLLRPGVVIRLR